MFQQRVLPADLNRNLNASSVRWVSIPRTIFHIGSLAFLLVSFNNNWVKVELNGTNNEKTMNEEKKSLMRISIFHHVLSFMLHGGFTYMVKHRDYILQICKCMNIVNIVEFLFALGCLAQWLVIMVPQVKLIIEGAIFKT